MAGPELRRDRHEPAVHVLDGMVAEMLLEPVAQPLSRDQARAGEVEVQEPEHPATRQGAGEVLQGIELAGNVATARDGADRGAGDDVGREASLLERFQHPDVRPAARCAAAQGYADLWLGHRCTLCKARAGGPGGCLARAGPCAILCVAV